MSLPRLSTRRPVAVAMFFLAVVLWGGIAYTRLPIDLLPDIGYPRLIVHTSYPEVAPSEVERRVTQRVESEAAAVPGVERVTSVSREGLSLVTLRFAWGTDMDFAMLGLRERLDELRDVLPAAASRPRILRVDPESEPILALSVTGDADLWQTKELAETVFRRRLEQLDGVARAAVTGGLDREIQVELDPARLRAYGLTPADVSGSLALANVSAPGGTIREGRYRYPLRTLGEFRTVEEIEEVVIARPGPNADGGGFGPVRLSDVGTVVDGFAERASIARLNGREAVGILVFKEPGANTVTVARAVDGVLEELRAQYPSVAVDVASSQAKFISGSIANVAQALVLGGVLAFLVLLLFLRDPRYAFAVAAAIPVSVVATFALMEAAGVSLNIMSLGGLALGVGMLVDNSIVVLENTFRHREGCTPALDAATVGAEEVAGAITASTLTTLCVFVPIVYVEGVAGALFGDLSLAVAFSLSASLVVALTLLPAWAGRFRTRAVGAGDGAGGARGAPRNAFERTFAAFAERYHRLLEAALGHPWGVLASAAAALVVALAVGSRLPRDLLPGLDQGAFDVRLRLPEGTTLDATAAAVATVESALLADPGVEMVFGRVGRDVRADGEGEAADGPESGRLQVRVREGHATEAVIARVRPVADGFAEAEIDFDAGQATALGRLLGGEVADIAVRVRSDDLDAAHARAEAVAVRLATLDRLANVRVGMGRGTPELRVEILRDRTAAYGIEPRAVAEALEGAIRGLRATEFVDFDRKIAVLVRYPEDVRTSRATLQGLRVANVPLRELVRVEEALGPAEVRREDQGRVVPVYADVARGGLDDAIAAVRRELTAFPVERDLRLEVGGENEEMRRSFRDLGFAFALALALVFMILAAQFESFLIPFVILAAVPLALVGAMAALAVTGRGLDTMSLIGVVILVGIVVNDAIVKVDFIHQARRTGRPLHEAILQAGRARLRPIVMTTLTTVLGLLPMAIGMGSGAELRAPLAIAVIGGLTGATVLTLVVVPVLYLVVERARDRVASSVAGGVATETGAAL